MGRKYNFEDVNTEAKPRIVAKRRSFSGVEYDFVCTGRGSVGYGHTPKHAYHNWLKNWKRRVHFYGQCERHAQRTIDFYTARVH